jgi:alpha-galactosidase
MKKYRYVFVVLLFVNSLVAVAGTAQQLLIETKNSLLVFTVGTNGKLYQSYFGQKPSHPTDVELLQSVRHEAYIGAGMGDLFEPAIRMVHADGNPSLDLVYAGHKTEKKGDDLSLTTITLKDPKYPVEVVLHFSAYFKDDVLKTWTEIKHQEKKIKTTLLL